MSGLRTRIYAATDLMARWDGKISYASTGIESVQLSDEEVEALRASGVAMPTGKGADYSMRWPRMASN